MKSSVLLLLLLGHFTWSEKHTLKCFLAGFSGIPDFPDFSAAAKMVGYEVFYVNMNTPLKIDQDLVEALKQIDPDLMYWYKRECFEIVPYLFKIIITDLIQSFNQTEEKNSLKCFLAEFSRIPNSPNFSAATEVDECEVFYDNSNKILRKYHDWIKALLKTDPNLVHWTKIMYFEILPDLFKEMINILVESFKQTEGVHVLQIIGECEWDDETGKVNDFIKYGYDGEDYISLDFKSLTLTVHEPKPITVPLDSYFNNLKYVLTEVCSGILQKYVNVTKHTQPRTVLPSVSLLQKSPFSPITCHATGFYPNSAVLFWRKDGEELHEDVEHGEILPNNDGSFQMSVELLNISSVKPEDWGKYECVFNLSGVKEEIITKLQKQIIRTNNIAPHDATIIIITISTIIAVAVVCCIIAAAYKTRRAKCLKSTPESSTELSERLRVDK